MGYNNVLVAYDGSDSAKDAIAEALAVIEENQQATLTVLEVETSDVAAAFGVESEGEEDVVMNTRQQRLLETLQQSVAPLIDGYQDRVQVRLVGGKPAKAIVDFANDNDCDLIVMGCRGLGAVRGMIGSVSNAVLRESKQSVLVIK